MEVKRNKPEVVTPPDTIDITGLTLREAGALRELVYSGLIWDDQPGDLADFFRELGSALDSVPFVNLRLSN